jgi:hypothetical protein
MTRPNFRHGTDPVSVSEKRAKAASAIATANENARFHRKFIASR